MEDYDYAFEELKLRLTTILVLAVLDGMEA